MQCLVNTETVNPKGVHRCDRPPAYLFLVSATLIHIPNYGYVLLDAGEGTWGQLARKFGDDLTSTPSVWQVLRELRCIFISHMHGDHHIGLAKLLAMRQRVSVWARDIEPHVLNVMQLDPPCQTPLYVVGHDNVFLYLHEYAALEELGLSPCAKSPVISISVDAIHWKYDFSSPRVEEASRRYACSQTYLYFYFSESGSQFHLSSPGHVCFAWPRKFPKCGCCTSNELSWGNYQA